MVNLYHERKCKSFFTEIKVTALQFLSSEWVRNSEKAPSEAEAQIGLDRVVLLVLAEELGIGDEAELQPIADAVADAEADDHAVARRPVMRSRRLEIVGQRQIGLGIADGIARLAAEPQGAVTDDGARKGRVGAVDIAWSMLPGVG